jgi:hypothetical protein
MSAHRKIITNLFGNVVRVRVDQRPSLDGALDENWVTKRVSLTEFGKAQKREIVHGNDLASSLGGRDRKICSMDDINRPEKSLKGDKIRS